MARRTALGTGTLVLDSEGLSKAAGFDERTAAFIKTALLEQARVVVPAVTLAEVLRGGPRDASVHRVLKNFEVAVVTGEVGRAAGELLGEMGGKNAIDAIVAAVARSASGPVVLLTSDVDDLMRLTDGCDDIAVQHV